MESTAKIKCKKCFGKKKIFKTGGFTSADLVECHVCSGTGFLPEGHSPLKSKTICRKRYYRKNLDMDKLKDIEAV